MSEILVRSLASVSEAFKDHSFSCILRDWQAGRISLAILFLFGSFFWGYCFLSFCCTVCALMPFTFTFELHNNDAFCR